MNTPFYRLRKIAAEYAVIYWFYHLLFSFVWTEWWKCIREDGLAMGNSQFLERLALWEDNAEGLTPWLKKEAKKRAYAAFKLTDREGFRQR